MSEQSAQDGAWGPARTLALTRIVAGLIIACSADLHAAVRFAGLDAQLTTPPSALRWLIPLQLAPSLVQGLTWLTVFAALVGAVGAYARQAFTLVSMTLFVLLALAQRVGAVTHSHHLLWVSLLLAVSPCADVWSADRYFDPRPLRDRAAYTVPLGFLRALVACIYFFPGLHKALSLLSGTSPSAWLLSHMEWKWLQRGEPSTLGLAIPSSWAGLLALGAIGFELSMPLLVSFRKTRLLSLAAVIIFHTMTAWVLFIRFDSLAVLWPCLVDFGSHPKIATGPSQLLRSAPPASRWMGAVLIAGALVTGSLGATQFYPFACYPTFAEQAPAQMPSARVELSGPGVRCMLARPQSNPEWVQAFRIAGAYGDPLTQLRAQRYLLQVLQTRVLPAACRAQATHVELWLESLDWDFARQTLTVAQERKVYSASSSAFGIAPADGVSSSSSPAK